MARSLLTLGRVELDQEGDGGEDMATTSIDGFFWNLGWD